MELEPPTRRAAHGLTDRQTDYIDISRRDSFARFGAVLGGEVKARRGSWGI